MSNRSDDAAPRAASNFIRDIIDTDLESGRHERVVTRFPPEPNGYLHIGHAKSIVLNFGIARDYNGICNLRFDDTNPETEDQEYADSIIESVRWLGYDIGENLFYASDYFDRFYQYALKLIRNGHAYVDSLSLEEIRQYRGTVTEPGRNSPYRDRTPEENEDLFLRMRECEFEDGEHVLRAKIDMSSLNMKMRDPLLYRIKNADHYRTGEKWCIYPMYDFAHPLEDAIEGITHSLCTLEFENNREVYDWVLEHTLEPHQQATRPRQYEFARLNLDYTVMSKRKLLLLVQENHVNGWDDPRMPTVAGMRRRGVPPEAIRRFAEVVGITRTDSRTDIGLLEHTIRDTLNFEAPRVMAVTRPLKIVITNYPEDRIEEVDAPYWPYDVPREGSRKVPFSRELYIEADDFAEDPPKGFHRLAPGREVRLRYAYLITCREVIKNEAGEIVELRCEYDPETAGGDAPDGRKVKGTLHWVSAEQAIPAEFRLYDRLFSVADPNTADGTFLDHLNEHSLDVTHGYVEPSVAEDASDQRYQFERTGYFRRDPVDAPKGEFIFNRIVSLRDSWAKKSESKPSTPKKSKPAEPAPVHRANPAELLDEAGLALFERLKSDFDVSENDAAVLAADSQLSSYYAQVVRHTSNHQSAINQILHELRRELKARSLDEIPIPPTDFAALVDLLEDETINSSAGQKVLSIMIETGGKPVDIVDEAGLRQMQNSAVLVPIVESVLAEFPDKVSAYRDGKHGLLGFFTGHVMRQTRGAANPQTVKALLEERLGATST